MPTLRDLVDGVLLATGSSEGARKGWETRRAGSGASRRSDHDERKGERRKIPSAQTRTIPGGGFFRTKPMDKWRSERRKGERRKGGGGTKLKDVTPAQMDRMRRSHYGEEGG